MRWWMTILVLAAVFAVAMSALTHQTEGAPRTVYCIKISADTMKCKVRHAVKGDHLELWVFGIPSGPTCHYDVTKVEGAGEQGQKVHMTFSHLQALSDHNPPQNCDGVLPAVGFLIMSADLAALEGGSGDLALCNSVDDDGDTIVDDGCPVGGTSGLLDAPEAPAEARTSGDVAPIAAAAGFALLGAAGWYARRRLNRR